MGGETTVHRITQQQQAIHFTGDLKLNDSVNLKIGTGDDFTIAHDGTDTTIQNDTGDLIVDVNDSSGVFVLKNDSTDVVKATDSYFQVKLGEFIPILTVLNDRVSTC